jgi:phospholipase C
MPRERLAMVLAGCVVVVAVRGSAPRPAPDSHVRRAEATSPIQHVVVLFQENHSFDDVLGKLCSLAAQGRLVRDPCDGATTGVLPDGSGISLRRAKDLVPPADHRVAAQARAINGGLMNGFGLNTGCKANTNYGCYVQYWPRQIPNVATLAQAFAVSDRTFEFRQTPSWTGHMVLAAATTDGFQGDNPAPGGPNGMGWGCDTLGQAWWWSGTDWSMQPSCIPDAQGRGPFRPSPVPFIPTIFDRVETAGLSWRIYGGEGGPGSGYGWTICPTFYECLGGAQRANLVAASDVLFDAATGKLPSLSIVTPTDENSQHNRDSMAQGDNWIGDVVDAVMNGPHWGSTAMFVTWDDCGCFYDHVPPPQPDRGIRVPMVIVSPFARPGFTDSNDATYLSILAYAEHALGLDPLNADDAIAYDYADAFNYAQRPLKPVGMIRTSIPEWERQWVRNHPSDPWDPT